MTPLTADPDDLQLPVPPQPMPPPAAQPSSPSLTGNPDLDAIHGLPPGAKDALIRMGQSRAASASPNLTAPDTPSPKPSITPITAAPPSPMLGGGPSGPTPSPITPITATSTISPRIQADQDELSRKQRTGSRISQIHNPWARIPLEIADAVGSSFFPKISALLPGTELHHQVLVDRDEDRLKTDEGVEKHEADLATSAANIPRTQAETRLENAQAENLSDETAKSQREENLNKTKADIDQANAQTQRLLHPIPTNEFEAWERDPRNTGKSVTDYEREKADATSKPLTPETAAALNTVWDPIAKKNGTAVGQFRPGMSAAEAKDVQTSLNQAVGKQQAGTRITIEGNKADVAAGKARDAQTAKEYTRAAVGLHKNFDSLTKQEAALDDAKQYIGGSAPAQAVGTIKTLSSLASGQGSGVRITQTELNALAHARGLGDSFEGWVNGLEGKGNLSKTQVAQIQSMLGDVEAKVHEKQQLYADTLDKLNAARSPSEIHGIESDLMKQQMGNGSVAGKSTDIPVITSKQDYDKLPSGATYYKNDKSGKPLVKK